ncbi:TPA: hypothetical protein DDX46_03085 [Candidatus Saccharibacteria bacterium]|nr:MAG: hypothetical protein UW38_C0001G0437 [Candidatus Saccharibacteria bacterium GW2011_GWC2_44_17]MBH1956022.1 hypothetical protein [Candidatus Saccharibacteria bacterium]OGL23677.1 MAG: hypothetical protein A2791_02465 [Candidatus Saccharibacteria bacterium RIFCSPHIGHO2_01_FULL_46_30]OGL33321.1 MAG: hypothetical protein A3E20_00130 [Candidatus Saccharibacteria bacterium RIFCSPHIGHO2_12_FULL_47_16]MBH1972410.1 hypothetical protein [Candidatus Saccharibacteria bacterium]
MQKDVIYIDVEDDITAIIGKVKATKEKVVALVPPKRIGVLQSAVNLRLLARTGELNDKRLVIITNNQALSSLASAAKIPVAKNLQSKPELAEIPALEIDDGDDVIDGEQLPVGELARTADTRVDAKEALAASAISGINIEDDAPVKATPPLKGASPAKPRVKSGIKVPNFGSFRKKAIIFGGLGVLLVGFLIWAIWFAPKATVVIDARTSSVAIKQPIAIGPTLETNAERATVRAASQQEKVASSVEFDATGTEDVGEKATGTMTLTRSAPGAVSVPYGTGFSNGNCTFTTQAQVSVPGASPVWNGSGFGVSPGTVDVKVQATAVGEECNLSARGYDSTVEGISATGSAMAGGSKRTIKIVTAADVQKATAQLKAQSNDEIKKKLVAKFGVSTIVIDESFTAGDVSPQSTPAVGGELKEAKAKLTSEVTYTMQGVPKDQLSKFLDQTLKEQLKTDEQQIYDNGLDKVKFTGYKASPASSVVLETTGQVGPKIDDAKIKELVKGKRFGEVQSQLKEIDGINDANTKFWPFWVQTVPNDVKKITIEFKIKNESGK